jgi:hypothetical protein
MQIPIPCECGRELTAEPGQAGLTLTCTCGRTVTVPSWRRPQGTAGDRLPEPSRSRLTIVGWTFLLLAGAAVVTASVAINALGMDPSVRRLFRWPVGGGALLVVVAIAAVLRVLGVRFYRD